MKKRIIALLLACCLVLSAAPVYAGAATGPQVTANAVSVTVGNTASVTLQAENFVDVAVLDVYVYYDASVFTVSSTTNGSILSNAQASVNTNVEGEIKLATMALDGINGSGSLLTIRFSTKSDAAPGTYPITLAIGRVYDGQFAPITIGSVSGSITVNKPVVTETFSLYSYPDKTALKKGDVLSYRVASASSSRAFVSGEFTMEYDHELFAFQSATLESALTKEGAIYSVNSSVLGQVRIAYANQNPVKSFYLFTVKLQVIGNVDTTTTIKAGASNMYREDLSMYLPGSSSKTFTLTKLSEVADYPNAFLKTEQLVVGQESTSTFCLEAGSGVAAADFRVAYDPTVLRCLGVTAVAEDAMVIINDTFDQGLVRFSYVNTAVGQEEAALVEIRWEPIQAPAAHYQTTLSGVGVVDNRQNLLQLEYVADTGCIYVSTVTEPTRTEDGRIDYCCSCGESFFEVLPAIPDPAAQVGSKLFATLEKALETAPEGSTVQLLKENGAAQSVAKSLVLDLNGFSLTGEMTVSEEAVLTVKDTQTDDYTVEDASGYGKLAKLSGNAVAAEGYLLITEEGAVSAHRVALEITDMVLRPSAAGLYYKSEFAGDEMVAQHVAKYGVALSVQTQPATENPGVCSWYDGFTSGSATGTLLKGIMKTRNSDSMNAQYAQMEIYGRAYILTDDGQYIFGECVSRSLRQQVEAIDEMWNTLDAQQQEALLSMYEIYAAVMNDWEIPNLQTATK